VPVFLTKAHPHGTVSRKGEFETKKKWRRSSFRMLSLRSLSSIVPKASGETEEEKAGNHREVITNT
jgi:hypothetical protein